MAYTAAEINASTSPAQKTQYGQPVDLSVTSRKKMPA
jgi:hypothetical protein